jgi:hypothetical protein
MNAKPHHDNLPGWTNSDAVASGRQGWGIFDCDGSENGRFQLCKRDEADILDSDAGAWMFVARQARLDDALAVADLAFLAEHNPGERATIRRVGGF